MSISLSEVLSWWQYRATHVLARSLLFARFIPDIRARKCILRIISCNYYKISSINLTDCLFARRSENLTHVQAIYCTK